MKLVKPEPLIIGGHAHYTLSSYDPVKIKVKVPYITETDIDQGIAVMVNANGGTLDDLKDDAWIRATFEGVEDYADLRDNVYDQLRTMSAEIAENDKTALCAEALAERLEQSVPQSSIEQYRLMMRENFVEQLARDNMTIENVAAASGLNPADFDRMFDEQAVSAVETEAALDALAMHRKLTVSDEELPYLMQISPAEAEEFLREASANGALEHVRQVALRSKALEIVIAECSCTYVHETPEEAALRSREMLEQQARLGINVPTSEPKSASTSHPHLKLV